MRPTPKKDRTSVAITSTAPGHSTDGDPGSDNNGGLSCAPNCIHWTSSVCHEDTSPNPVTPAGVCALHRQDNWTCPKGFTYVITTSQVGNQPGKVASAGCVDTTKPTPAELLNGAVAQAMATLVVTPTTAIVQPKNNRPLPYGLPAYFEAADTPQPGSSASVGGESVTLTLHDPTYTWTYGDGTAPYATTDRGGPYPNGRVQHVYEDPGHYTASLDVHWQLTVSATGAITDTEAGGGLDQALPSVVDITVVEARGVLVY